VQASLVLPLCTAAGLPHPRHPLCSICSAPLTPPEVEQILAAARSGTPALPLSDQQQPASSQPPRFCPPLASVLASGSCTSCRLHLSSGAPPLRGASQPAAAPSSQSQECDLMVPESVGRQLQNLRQLLLLTDPQHLA